MARTGVPAPVAGLAPALVLLALASGAQAQAPAACATAIPRVLTDPEPNTPATPTSVAGFVSNGDGPVVFTRGRRPAEIVTLGSNRCGVTASIESTHATFISAAGPISASIGSAVIDPFATTDRAAVTLLSQADVTAQLGRVRYGGDTGSFNPPAMLDPAVRVEAGGALNLTITGIVQNSFARSCIRTSRGENCFGANGSAVNATARGFATLSVAEGAAIRSAATALTLTSAGGRITNRGLIEGLNLTGTAGFTVETFGQITGGIRTGAGDDTLILRPGSTTTGSIDLGGGFDRLMLQGTYTFSGVGSPVADLEMIEVGDGGRLRFALGSVSFPAGSAPSFTALSTAADIQFRPGSTLEMNVGSLHMAATCPGCIGSGDTIRTSGTIAIDGAALVLRAPLGSDGPLGGSVLLNRQLLMSATGGITGRFSSVSLDSAFLTPLLEYAPTRIDVVLVRNDVSFVSLANSANQRAVAAGVQAGGVASRPYQILLLQSAANAPGAYDALSGEAYATRSTLAIEQGELRRRALSRRLRQSNGRGASVWADTGVSEVTVDSAPGVAGFESEQVGITFGQEFAAKGWSVGLAQTYVEDDQSVPERQSRVEAQGWTGSAYGAVDLGRLRVSAIASLTRQRARLSRSVLIGPPAAGSYADYRISPFSQNTTPEVSGTQTGRLVLDQAEAQFEVATPIPLSATTLEPFASVAWVRQDGDPVSETGGAAALTVTPSSRDLGFARMGLRLHQRWRPNASATIDVDLSAGYRRAGGDLRARYDNGFASGEGSFRIKGARVAPEAVELGLDLTLDTRHGGLFLAYQTTDADGFESQGLRLGGRFAF